MALDYDKLQKKHLGDNEGFWTAYADLMTVMSILFLLMYAVSTMRSTTISVAEKAQMRVAQEKISHLEEQITAFEVLKDEYLNQGATSAEKKMYKDLMSQMQLLEQQAAEEKAKLYAQAKETEQKAQGLNHYQSVIKNIITANMIAQSEMKSRDKVIAKKTQNIKEMRADMRKKEELIAANNKAIADTDAKLKQTIKEVEYAYRSKKRSKEKMDAEIERLRVESQKKVAALRKENQVVSTELKTTQAELGSKSEELQEKQTVLVQRQTQLAALEQEKALISQQLKKEQKVYQETVDKLQAQHESRLADERKNFQASLAQADLSAQAKIEKEKAYRAKVEQQVKEYNDKVANLANQLDSTKTQIVQKERELAGTKEIVQKKQAELEGTRQATAALEAKYETRLSEAQGENKKMLAVLADRQKAYESSMQELKNAHEAKLERERQALEAQMEKEKLTAAQRVAQEGEYRKRVEAEKNRYAAQMDTLNQQLQGTKAEIAGKEKELAGAKAQMATKEAQFSTQLAAADAEKKRIIDELAAKQKGFEQNMKALDGEYQKRLEGERGKFEASLAKEKLTGAQRQARELEYRKKLEGDRLAYEGRMKELSGQLDGTKAAIAQREMQFKSAVGKLSAQNAGMAREIAAVRARDEQKKRVIKKIADSFAHAGIDARVDPKTGDVTINFGEEYFDYGSSAIKGAMQKILERAVPLYAKSVLEDSEIAEKISSVEIIGFASPTYKGKYINPKELSAGARKAVNYNMDLSYKRAKSIFEYVFDPKAMKYDHQNRLLTLTKVTGLGYLRAQGANDAVDGKLSDAQYCEKYDCTKSQKVLIKFNFKD